MRPHLRPTVMAALAATAALAVLASCGSGTPVTTGAEPASGDADGALGTVPERVSDPDPAASPDTTAAPVGPVAPDAIRATDFTNFVFPEDSCRDVFHTLPVDGYRVVDGEASSDDSGHGHGQVDHGHDDSFSVTVRPEVGYGDVTGDGIEEALVVIECSPGTHPFAIASLWTPTTDGPPRRVAMVMEHLGTDPGRGEHRLETAMIDGATVTVTWQVYGEGAAMCCPTESATVTLVWRDSALVAAAPAVYTPG